MQDQCESEDSTPHWRWYTPGGHGSISCDGLSVGGGGRERGLWSQVGQDHMWACQLLKFICQVHLWGSCFLVLIRHLFSLYLVLKGLTYFVFDLIPFQAENISEKNSAFCFTSYLLFPWSGVSLLSLPPHPHPHHFGCHQPCQGPLPVILGQPVLDSLVLGTRCEMLLRTSALGDLRGHFSGAEASAEAS